MTLGTGIQSTGNPVLDFLVTMPFVLGFWNLLIQALPAILAGVGGLFGGDDNTPEDGMPQQLPPLVPEYQQGFFDLLFNRLHTNEGGGVESFGHQAFPGTARTPYSGSLEGPGVDMIGNLSPDIANTILPRVYDAWQPMDAGTMHLANFLTNGPIGQEDPRARHVMEWGGFGGPGHDAMVSAAQFGVPSEAAGRPLANLSQFGVANSGPGQYLANLAQYGVTSTPMADFMRAATSGGLNPHRKVPVPPRG